MSRYQVGGVAVNVEFPRLNGLLVRGDFDMGHMGYGFLPESKGISRITIFPDRDYHHVSWVAIGDETHSADVTIRLPLQLIQPSQALCHLVFSTRKNSETQNSCASHD
jgi:hypothetical protein